MEDSLRVAQDALRAAIDASALLTARRRQYGEAWLRNLVKVHVNITNAADPSFWSWKVVSRFPLPDAWMRDHRKIVFYDVAETDPFRGEAILTGAGVGEHYTNAAWEDRSLLVQGPALLALKSAARNALLKQGKLDDAAEAYRRSLAEKPNPAVSNALGEVLHQMGRTDEAAAENRGRTSFLIFRAAAFRCTAAIKTTVRRSAANHAASAS